jgi:hypothetical protein
LYIQFQGFGVNSTKLFTSSIEGFFRFLLLILAIFHSKGIIFLYYKHSSLTAKIGKQLKQSLIGLTPGKAKSLLMVIRF